VEINGVRRALPGPPETAIRFNGESEPGMPLRWEIV